MQGERTEESIIAALDRIYAHHEAFDAVVIIRGGGSTADLSSFDSYALAAHCAQFPLPIITGIGHERDDTVVDLVAHTRLKTPTAVAAFLIDCMALRLTELTELRDRLCRATNTRIEREQQTLHTVAARFPLLVAGHIERRRAEWHRLSARLAAVPQLIERHRERIAALPLRLRDGIIVKRAASLSPGDAVTLRFADGEQEAQIV